MVFRKIMPVAIDRNMCLWGRYPIQGEPQHFKMYCLANSLFRKKKIKIQKLYLKTIHSNTNNTSSMELLNRLSNKHKIVTENMHDSS
jgi:hypothetical protein